MIKEIDIYHMVGSTVWCLIDGKLELGTIEDYWWDHPLAVSEPPKIALRLPHPKAQPGRPEFRSRIQIVAPSDLYARKVDALEDQLRTLFGLVKAAKLLLQAREDQLKHLLEERDALLVPVFPATEEKTVDDASVGDNNEGR